VRNRAANGWSEIRGLAHRLALGARCFCVSVSIGQFLCRDETERRRVTDLGRRLRPGVPLMLGAFVIAGVSGVATYGWLPLLPPAAALALYAVMWLLHPTRRARPEYAYAAAFLFAEAMLALGLVIGHGPRGYALSILAMPVLIAAVLFPRRVVLAAAAIGGALLLGVTFGVDLPEVRAIPAVAYTAPFVLVSLVVTALVVRELDDASRRSAFVDELTGVLNRAALAPRVAELTHQAKTTNEPVAVIVADIDHFKAINDQRGHVTGDWVLREVARRLSDCLSAFEPVYRLGGEEFLILLPGLDARAAHQVALKMWRTVRERAVERLPATMSFGVASSSPKEPFDFDAIFARADRALYEAKQAGRDQVRSTSTVGATAVRSLRARDGTREPHETLPRAPVEAGDVRTVEAEAPLPGAPAVTEELEREHVVDLNRRLATLFRVIAVGAFVCIAAAIPWFGWHPLIAPVVGAILYFLLSRSAHRFRRPGRALGIGWALFQTSIAVGFAFARGAPLFALALLVLMVPGRCAVLRTRAAAVGTAYTALLVTGVAFYLDAPRIIGNPSILLFPLALLVEAGYIGSVVGGSAVGFRGAGVTDGLTGLLNRTALCARMLELEAQAASVPHRVAIVLADLDHFKEINDEAGHRVGDEVLRDVAVRIRACLRTFESAYRVGGEEFLVLLPDVGMVEATQVADRLLRAVRSMPCSGVPVTMSIGVAATAPGERFAYHEVFARADAALYEAKRSGRDRVCADTATSEPPPFVATGSAA
jgi:diguanylate cyclase (GGDEF)-like protein